MRVWFIGFLLLFGATELLQWVKQFSLPLPIFILGGAFLAVASNYDKLTELPFHPEHDRQESPQETLTESAQKEVTLSEPVIKTPVSRNSFDQSISFTIHKPHQPGD